jgi:hypothetical protein
LESGEVRDETKKLNETLYNELKESRELNERLRIELKHVIEFNVALQHDIDAMSRPVETVKSVHVHSTIPRDDIVPIGPFLLEKGRAYVLESHLTCINISLTDECGTVIGMYEQGNTHILGTGAAAWNGRVNKEDDNPYGGMHTVLVRAIFTPSETKEYTFELHEIGKKHTQLLLNHPAFPCITVIL